jgi:hypothetical protein
MGSTSVLSPPSEAVTQHGTVKMHQAECPLRPRRHLQRLFISWARCTLISGFKYSAGSATFGQLLHYLQSQCMTYGLNMLAFGIISGEFPVLRSHLGGILRDWFSPSELIRVNFLYFGIISAGFRENDSFTFGINSVDFSHFGASAQTQCLSASVRNQPNLVMEDKWVRCFLNNWEFVVTFVNRLRLIGETYLNWEKSPISIHIIMARDEGILWRGSSKRWNVFHLRNHLGAIFITFRNYLGGISRNHLQPSCSVSRLSFVSQGYKSNYIQAKRFLLRRSPQLTLAADLVFRYGIHRYRVVWPSTLSNDRLWSHISICI